MSEINNEELQKKQKKFNKKYVIIFIIVAIILLIGIIYLINRKGKEYGYQLSELTPFTTSIGSAHLKGSIKNVSNKDCKEIKINIEFSNGSLTEEGWIIIDSPEIGEIVSFDEVLLGASEIENIEKYDIKLKNIECYKEKKMLEPREFKVGDKLTSTELEDYFEEIYDTHTLLGLGICFELEEVNYPYINEITYKNEGIEIEYSAKYNDSTLSMTEIYNVNTYELESLYFFISNSNDEIESKIKSSVATSSVMYDDVSESINLLRALNTEIEEGNCIFVNNKWYISYLKNKYENLGETLMYFISINNS